MSSKQEAEIKRLQQQVKDLKLASSRKKKEVVVDIVKEAPKRRRNKKGGRGMNPTMTPGTGRITSGIGHGYGECRMRWRSIYFDVTIPAGKGYTAAAKRVSPENISAAAAMNKLFERYRIEQCKFWYKPAVGTTTDGLWTMAIDMEGTSPASGVASRDKLCTYQPNQSGAVWEDTENRPMVFPQNMLRTREWYFTHQPPAGAANAEKLPAVDLCPGALLLAIKSDVREAEKSFGEIWIDITVLFSGPYSE